MSITIYGPLSSENLIVGDAQLLVDGTDVGYTSGGFTIGKSNDYLDIVADQAGGKLKKLRTNEMMTLSTTLLESTIANLQIAFNEPAGNLVAGGSMLVLGDADLTTPEHTLKLIGDAPNSKTRTFEFFRAVLVDDISMPFGVRDQVQTVPVGFELLKDEDRNNAFGHFWDND